MRTLRQLIEFRIEDADLGFKEVKGAASLKNIMAGLMSAPGCYIFNQQDKAGKNETIGKVNQRVQRFIAVVIITKNVRDTRGSDASDDNEVYATAVSQSLLGWTPDGYEPIEYKEGKLVNFNNGFYVWMDTYQTANFIRG